MARPKGGASKAECKPRVSSACKMKAVLLFIRQKKKILFFSKNQKEFCLRYPV
jgi:hypothetical protein